MPRKKSLAEEISDLLAPKTADLDPEDAAHAGFASAEGLAGGEELAGELGGEDGRLLLKGDIALEDGAYEGRAVSRREAFGDDDSEEAFEDDDSEEAFEDDDSEEAFEDAMEMDSGDEDDEGESVEEEDDDEDEDDEEEQRLRDVRLQEVSKELEELEQEESALKVKQGDGAAEKERSSHARNQVALWDACLGMRIRMQKVLTESNRLPQPESRELFEAADPEVAEVLATTVDNSLALLDDLLTLDAAVREENGQVPQAPVARAGSKRSLDEMWEHISAANEALLPYERATINKWSDRTQLAAASSQKKLKAINQSVVAQIDQVMADKERLVLRSRRMRTPVHIMGKPAPSGSDEVVDAEIFDDTDFYAQLLREFVARGASGNPMDPVAMSRQALATRKLTRKTKKSRDNSAAKGRKIRYQVMEKLVNFMPPVPREISPMVDELCAGMFGR